MNESGCIFETSIPSGCCLMDYCESVAPEAVAQLEINEYTERDVLNAAACAQLAVTLKAEVASGKTKAYFANNSDWVNTPEAAVELVRKFATFLENCGGYSGGQ